MSQVDPQPGGSEQAILARAPAPEAPRSPDDPAEPKTKPPDDARSAGGIVPFGEDYRAFWNWAGRALFLAVTAVLLVFGLGTGRIFSYLSGMEKAVSDLATSERVPPGGTEAEYEKRVEAARQHLAAQLENTFASYRKAYKKRSRDFADALGSTFARAATRVDPFVERNYVDYPNGPVFRSKFEAEVLPANEVEALLAEFESLSQDTVLLPDGRVALAQIKSELARRNDARVLATVSAEYAWLATQSPENQAPRLRKSTFRAASDQLQRENPGIYGSLTGGAAGALLLVGLLAAAKAMGCVIALTPGLNLVAAVVVVIGGMAGHQVSKAQVRAEKAALKATLHQALQEIELGYIKALEGDDRPMIEIFKSEGGLAPPTIEGPRNPC